jgi:hypothetical protein
MEWFTIWGYTHEEILHRWDVWKQFDIVTRIFGSDDKGKKEEKTPVNTEATFAALAGLFGPNFMNQTSEETKPDAQQPIPV